MSLNIEENVSLKNYTTLRVGGLADYLVTVESEEELEEALHFASQNAAPLLIMGSGSNVFISDEGFRGLVIVNDLKGVEYAPEGDGQVYVRVGAGEVFDELVADSIERGYWGLENLSDIPGTVGATPVQNVGAYGVEIADLVTEVKAIDVETGEEKVFSNEECAFAYRDSFFKTPEGRKCIITAVTFRLNTSPTPRLEYKDLRELMDKESVSLEEIRDKVMAVRSTKFPDWTKVGTAGSFFKNPIIKNEEYQALLEEYPDLPGFAADIEHTKIPLGFVLDKICNLKGHYQDGVGLYEKQALVLVNDGNQSAAAIEEFASYVEEEVKNKIGVVIEREVRTV